MCHTTFTAFSACQHTPYQLTTACEQQLIHSVLFASNGEFLYCPRRERQYATEWQDGLCAACLAGAAVAPPVIWAECGESELDEQMVAVDDALDGDIVP